MTEQRINAYTCDAGHRCVTIDRVEGTTPFMIACQTDGCDLTAKSALYRVGDAEKPTHEWYRPDSRDVRAETERAMASRRKKFGPSDHMSFRDVYAMIDGHVQMGGLLMRKIEQEDERGEVIRQGQREMAERSQLREIQGCCEKGAIDAEGVKKA